MSKGATALIIFGIIGIGGIFIMFNSQKAGQKQASPTPGIPGPTEQIQGVPTRPQAANSQSAQENTQPAQDPTELQIVDIKVGDGKEATSGATVSVHYTGTLLNGQKFDSSRDRGQPFSFLLGAGQVIQGWDRGVQGMKVGGVRKLVIPSNLAYGEAGSLPVIPPNSPLDFDIELLDVQ